MADRSKTMSRLESHKNNVYKKQLTFFILLFIIAIIFIFFFGFKILFNTSLFINQTFNKDVSQISPTQANFFGDISIDSIPQATNSATIQILGSIDQYDQLAIYLNSRKIEEIKIASNSFSFEVKNLQKGENIIYFLAKSLKTNEKKQTDTFKVFYNDEKPKIEIKEPPDGLKTSKSEILIIGTTGKENNVKVNSFPVVTDVNGGFQTAVKLNNGENKIVVNVLDNYGNSEEKTLTVTKED